MKNKMMRTLLLGFLVLIFAFAFAACDNGQQDEPKSPVVYSITFDAGQGVLTGTAEKAVTKGETVGTLPEVTPPDGYSFEGWFDDTGKEWTSASVFDGSADIKLTAEYLAVAYSIEYHMNGGVFTEDGLSEFSAYTIENDVILPTAEVINKPGHTFAGWYDNAAFEGETKTSIAKGSTGDKEFFAKYSIASYNVTAPQSVDEMFQITAAETAVYNTDYIFTVKKLNPLVTVEVTIGDETYELEEPISDNYTIAGNAIVGDIVISVNEPVQVTAPTNEESGFVFAGEEYAVKNGTYRFSITPDIGYKIFWVKISDEEIISEDGTNYVYSVGTENFAITVSAGPIVYSIAFDKNDTIGSTLAAGEAETIENIAYNAPGINLPSLTREGYAFMGWAYSKDAVDADFKANELENVGNMENATHGGTVTLYAIWKANSVSVSFSSISNVGILGTDPSVSSNKAGYTAKQLDAQSLTGGKAEAVFDTPYTFNEPVVEGYEFNVMVTIKGVQYSPAYENGTYTIEGGDIDGNIEIKIEKHVKGIDEVAEKANYTYTDGGTFTNFAERTGNGNSVSYEGYRDAHGNAYFRITVLSGKIDNVGDHSNSDNVRLVFRKSDGSGVTIVHLAVTGVYWAGLPDSPWTSDNGINSNMKSVSYSFEEGNKIKSVYELMIPSAQMSLFGAADKDLYFSMAFETKAGETNSFAGKANVNAHFWAKYGGDLSSAKIGYSTLLNESGIYDYDGQAKLDTGIVIDGKLEEDVWKNMTGLSYSGTAGKAEYKGFVTEQGIYYAAHVEHTDVSANQTVAVLAMFFGKNGWTDGFRVREDLNMVGNISTDCYGTAYVTISRGETYKSTFEAFIPFRELKAKHGIEPVVEGEDISITAFAFYQNNQIENNLQWKVDGYGSLTDHNFKFTETGLEFLGNTGV